MAVVAVLQVNTDLLSCLHLELVYCLTSLGNIDLIVVLPNDTSLSVLTESSAVTIALPNLRRKHIVFLEKLRWALVDSYPVLWRCAFGRTGIDSFICIGYLSAL